MKILQVKAKRQAQRKLRIRAKITGTEDRPRFSVFRSNAHIYGQLIDDENGKTLVSCTDLGIKSKSKETKVQVAAGVGEELAKKALAKKIKKVVFDRNGFRFHGRVKALADGARKGGLEF
ncbi:MAG: 50S ribosomal protein L18, large subunit ribosomal protein L18 [Microgenomates group bacterium GW2011_GWC1_41_20]|uniref:Large ribosomal subunit protein uL18 n=7 Tax=Candidatus Woeseibacteriota TaxID=1752722 RepID=A0A0G0U9S0_9BACT|nr:MAG: 50S ribosomal protein L18 [Candidatus Woesebacteria bacterium GW2011_GWB1_40_12]KKR56235.1 MAG: 50S ribosomal protein L18 [Candidatus Woesebacteria bacterium GW2011_GWF1_40_24]KKR90741.1 MAG: 50S ribosomal protein L18 [Candidatus Woesebacteria bacterium GW2011_GWD1_41_12]KKS00786.1 MAG: 50S ribosomal protein L18, large subunit ribosomal protein L18 [Microgenomates group bacterium GW2011_GWC1_41_20]KKS05775.1 MAG: 50S ribosomal protein L18 [Candidatus Woesebacteria bacterium GW2011_GWE1_